MQIRKLLILFIAFFTLVISSSGAAHESLKIRVKLDDTEDTLLYLAYYFGDKTYLIDTAVVNKKVEFVFFMEKKPEQGMYIVADQNKNKLFEFLYCNEGEILFEATATDITGSLKVKGSKENEIFFKYLHFLSESQAKLAKLQKIAASAKDEDSIAVIRKQVEDLDKEVKGFRKSLISSNKQTFAATFINATLDTETPPAIYQSTMDSSAVFYYYKDHFWDHFDLSDDRLLRTPLFQTKLDQFMTKMVIPLPDSIIPELDRLLEKAAGNEEVYKYLLWHFIVTYERSEVMGYDAIFVHLVDDYIRTGSADKWLNSTVKENLIRRATILQPLLLGKTAPLMILLDTNNIPVSLYHIQARYTIIYFWDTDCGHCKKETPRLKKFYDDNKEKLEMEVYAVCIDTSLAEWKSYIHEHNLKWVNVSGYLSMTPDFHDLYDVHSSPVIYLLDQDKTILAKRILTEQVSGLISRKEREIRE